MRNTGCAGGRYIGKAQKLSLPVKKIVKIVQIILKKSGPETQALNLLVAFGAGFCGRARQLRSLHCSFQN